MRLELPEFKRCCFCMPLRYGLITWGYIKFILTLLIIVPLSIRLHLFVRLYLSSSLYIFIEDIIFASLLLLLSLLDICFTIVFLVGGHQKSGRLLHIYYIYSVVLMCLFTLLFTIGTILQVIAIVKYVDGIGHFVLITQMHILIGVFIIGTNAYIILLLRSEINKLRNRSEYRFGNPTVATEPTVENGSDTQFEGVINNKAEHEDFSYNKF